MARGRKADPPGVQAAKGYPGKRKSKVKTAERRAESLAGAPATGSGPLDPPAFLQAPGLDEAAKIWAELAPLLAPMNLLGRIDRHTFARWCIYQADWIAATLSIASDGAWMMVPNVNGEPMPRRNPACLHREKCESAMQSIEAAFGITPAHRYKLLRDQASLNLGGLFGERADESDKPSSAPAPEDDVNPIGVMARLASTPPGQRPN